MIAVLYSDTKVSGELVSSLYRRDEKQRKHQGSGGKLLLRYAAVRWRLRRRECLEPGVREGEWRLESCDTGIRQGSAAFLLGTAEVWHEDREENRMMWWLRGQCRRCRCFALSVATRKAWRLSRGLLLRLSGLEG